MAEYTKPKNITDGQNQQELFDRHLLQLSERITDETTRRRLGLCLGLEHHEVKVSRTDNRDEITTATFEMLQKWFQGKPDRHTAWLELTQALRDAGLDLYIKEVLKVPNLTEIEKRSSDKKERQLEEFSLIQEVKNLKQTVHELRARNEGNDRVENFIRNNCTLANGEEVNVYLANHVVTHEDATKQIRKVEVGQRQPGCEKKVILIVGATGSGKSTLINGMFNYIFGVEWTDDYRLKLIQEVMHGQEANQVQSQTRWITAYTIHHRPEFTIPYTLTIIDTPGFGNTGGIERDREITDQTRALFTTPGQGGVESIDVVGFVAQSALPRLTPAQKYIFDSVLSLFGRDIEDNIFMLLTSADAERPQILAGIEEAKVPYKKYFKFNNSSLFAAGKGGMKANEYGTEDNFKDMFWKMNSKYFEIFMVELSKLQKRNLILTKDVFAERSHLELTIEGVQRDVKMGLNKLEQLRVEHQALDQHQAEIDKNKNFTYTVDEQIIETEPTTFGQYTTNCITCNRTCHEDCPYADDADKKKCRAMGHGKNGEYCRICPSHCHWSMHKNQPYIYVIKTHKVTKTSGDLKKRYQEALGKKLTAEQLVNECRDEFEAAQMRVLSAVDQARKNVDKLDKIALRSNPLSIIDYIDISIHSEKAEAKPGWKERVIQLQDVKEKAEQMQAMTQQGYDPFAAVKKEYDDERIQRKQMRQQLNK